jgi:long-chain acyl-CoA synthetase
LDVHGEGMSVSAQPARRARSVYWPDGVPRTLEYPAVSLTEFLESICRHHGDRVAIEDGEERLSYTRLLEEASVVANALRADRVEEGDVVLLHLPNSVWWVVSYVGVLLAGATVSPASPLQPAAGLRSQLVEVGAVAAISHPDHAPTLLEAREGTRLRRVVVAPGTDAAPATAPIPAAEAVVGMRDWMSGRSTEPPAVTVTPESVAHLAFTGGTTGVSKAVRVLHRNMVANIAQSFAWRTGRVLGMRDGAICMTPAVRDDTAIVVGRTVGLTVAPLYHAQALYNMALMLAAGGTTILLGRFTPERMLERIEQRRVTYTNGSPSMWHALLACPQAQTRDLSSLRVVSSGAAPIDGETMRGLRKIFPSAMLNEGYGLTEAVALVAATPGYRDVRRKLGSVGQPIPDTELEIRDDAGRVLGPGERGELWVRGPQVTGGYHGHDDLTAAQFVDGWLRTGDIAYVDEEGFVFICDRAKDVLLYKGYNVYPRELEELLVQHPDIDAAAVVGRDDVAVGQVPVAFVVPRDGAHLHVDEVLRFVATRVAPYQKIREVHVVEKLPTSAPGKILKNQLRKQVNAGRR